MPQFRTKRNRLTRYSFMCGYVETRQQGNIETRLWAEGPCYHVRQYDNDSKMRIFWESFETLTEARKFFDKQSGKLVKG